LGISFPTFEVVKSMIAYGMTAGFDLFKNIGVFSYIVANAKKGGFGIVLF